MFKSFFRLIFPNLCVGCEEEEPLKGEFFCILCLRDLPIVDRKTDAWSLLEGKKNFPWNCLNYFTLMYYEKGGIAQSVLHKIKYDLRSDLAIAMGELLATRISDVIKDHTIVPVPLHPKKLYQRGFNQANKIAEGMESRLELTVDTSLLFRTQNQNSQTKSTQLERGFRLESSFYVKTKKNIPSKVLLVDDVVTTGATLHSCFRVLKEAGVKEISIATLAVSI